MIMKENKRYRILIIAGISGILYTIFLLYKRRGGYLINIDLFSILIVVLFVFGLVYYFRKKLKEKE
jgi:hypothetical protein